MNDKERILMNILSNMYFTQIVRLKGDRECMFDDGNSEYVHFGGYDDRPIQRGDLVLCQTTGLHDWKIGFVHQVIDSQACIIREIGGNRTCNVSNERFVRIAGIPDDSLLEGDEYIFKQKVLQAFHRGDEYMYRFGGVDFLAEHIARIWIREAFGGVLGGKGKMSTPFSFEMKWNKRTSIKLILETMRENGYGTRDFEYTDNAQTSPIAER